MNKQQIYYPGLNGIRAIAALTVLIFHIDLVLPAFGLQEIGFHRNNMAGYGVIMFFVLSGFLITSLLLHEKSHTENISIKNFYVRRILRIWPLYYWAILIAFVLLLLNIFTLNKHSYFFFYLFFIPNVAFATKMTILPISPLWSVGVEEQFYAFWPWLVKFSNKLINKLVLVIMLYFFVKLIARFTNGVFYDFVNISAFDCMAIGGIGAIWVFDKEKYRRILKIVYNKFVQILAWFVLFISFIYKPIHLFSFIDQEINALIYLILIINVSSNPNTLISLENNFFDFIGKISYGIYVYHFIIIVGLSHFLKHKFPDNFWGYLTVFVLIIFSTIFISYISYKYLEKWFLNRKVKYSYIVSKYAKKE
ncbi:MAG: acyltransferase [Bacteroidales bacterium]